MKYHPLYFCFDGDIEEEVNRKVFEKINFNEKSFSRFFVMKLNYNRLLDSFNDVEQFNFEKITSFIRFRYRVQSWIH